jgi:predicted  nucleic acid-binding Zn-ribbon protein
MMGLVSPATAAVAVMLDLSEAAVNFAKQSIQAFSEYEMIKTNLELVMGSAEQAGDTFKELRDLAAKTPFDLPGVSQAASMLRQAGVEAGDLVSTIEMLGNVSGGNMERFNRIAYNYTQVLQKGVLDARDTREFANNLVPINKALQQLGVVGKATSDDMINAFRLMTQEGGMFFNAINRQGETMIGRTEQMKEAWTEFQATWAETSGLGELWKSILENLTKALQEHTEALRAGKEAQEAREAIALGRGTNQDYIADIEGRIATFQRLMNKSSDISIIRLFQDEITVLEDLARPYRELLDRERARTAELEMQAKLIEDQKKLYNDFMGGVNSAYESSIQGKIEALRKTVADNERVLSQGLTRQVPNLLMPQVYGPQLPGGDTVTATGLLEEERRRIEMVIGKARQELESLLKQLDASLLTDWQQLLQSTLGISDQAAREQLSAIEEYTTGFYKRLGGALAYAQMAGEDSAEVYGEFADEIERAMKALMYSGEFDAIGNAMQGLSALLSKIENLGKSQSTSAWRDILKDATGFSDEEINAWEDRKAIVSRYITKMQSAELDAKIFDTEGLVDYADALSGIADGWEEVYKIITSASIWKDGVMIQVFDPTLEENAEIIATVFKMMKEARGASDLAKEAKYTSGLEKQLDLEKQLFSGEISRNEYAAQQLSIQQDISIETARQAVALQKQIETYSVLGDLLKQIGQTSLSSLVEMAH